MKQQMGSIGHELTSFRHFSKQLRLETAAAAFSSLSIGDSIWSDTVLQAAGKAAVDCRNFPSTVSPELRPGDGWTTGLGDQKLAFTHSCFNRIKNNEDYSSSVGGFSHKSFGFNKSNVMLKSNYLYKSNRKSGGGKKNRGSDAISGKTNSRSNGVNKSDMDSNGNVGAVDKRFKVLPPSEALPRSEAVGGYIFVCNNDTMQENLNRQLFGLPSRYRDSVRAITPGLPLFLYNYSTHQLFGIFQAASFGGANIDPLAWEDKKNPGESRFPAQVRIVRRKLYDPLEEDSFRPFLHHYDGPKFRLELSVPEALALLDIFSEQNV